MSEIIIVDGYRLKLETGDEIEIERHMCGRCECEHTKLTVTRNGKEIACLGDHITLDGKDEVYGGVLVDKDDNVLPDPHWVCHILRNDMSCMTEDKMSYVGICGKVLDHAPENKHDRITFITRLGTIDSTLRKEEKDRLCPKCLETYNDRNAGMGSSKTQ